MLEVRDISLKYGAARVLKSVSLDAQQGKITCVMGRNGVGKTSLLRAIVGLHPLSGGAIRFGGQDIAKLSAFDRARHPQVGGDGFAQRRITGRVAVGQKRVRVSAPAATRQAATTKVVMADQMRGMRINSTASWRGCL